MSVGSFSVTQDEVVTHNTSARQPAEHPYP